MGVFPERCQWQCLSFARAVFEQGWRSAPGPLYFFRQPDGQPGSFRLGWSHNYDISLHEDTGGHIALRRGLKGRTYLKQADGTYVSQFRDNSALTKSAEGYLVTEADGQIYRFDLQGRIAAIEDRFGNSVIFTYPGPDQTAIRDPLGRQITIHYLAGSQKIDRITGPAGADFNFTYHADSGMLWQVIAPAPTPGAPRPTWTYLYTAAGRLEYKIDPEQNSVKYVYNLDGSLKETFDPQLQKKSVVFDSTHGTTTVTEKDLGQWIYRYDSIRRVLESKTDPENNVTSYTYYPSGQTLSKTIPGHSADQGVRYTTFYTYDPEGKVLTETVPVNMAAYGLTPESITDPAQLAVLDPPVKTALRYTYDPDHFGQIRTIIDERGATAVTTTYTYTTEADPQNPSILYEVTTVADPSGIQTKTRKYPDGQLKDLTDGNGRVTQFTYYPDGHTWAKQIWYVVDPHGIRTEYSDYDSFGNPRKIKVVDGQGGEKATDFVYDGLGRLTASSVTGNPAVPGGDPTSYQTLTGYDGNGYRNYLRDAEGHETRFENNYKGKTTVITDALLNRTEFTFSGAGCPSCGSGVDALTAVIDANHVNGPEPRKMTSFAYYQTGKLKSETDPLGKTVLYTYYPSGLLHRKLKDVNDDREVDSGDQILLTYTYTIDGQVETKLDHVTGEQTSYTYYPNGRLWTAANPAAGYTFDYYDNGWLKSVTDNSGRTIHYDAYDGVGQRDLVTLFPGTANERVLDYGYDTKGRLQTITTDIDPQAPGNEQFVIGYDNWSRRGSLTYPNGVVATYSYHPDMDWLTGISYADGMAPPLADVQYPVHDKVGNRKERKEDGISTIYGYDSLYQLLSATTGPEAENFTFDPVGNRKSGPTIKDTELAAYEHDDANRMLQGRKFSYGYDDLGNQTSRVMAPGREWAYTWDGENRLTKAELKKDGDVLRTVSFKYDPFGRRIEKKVVDASGTVTRTYVYDGEDIVLEYVNDSAATTLTHYVHGPGIDEPLAVVRGGQAYYYHADGLGSVVAITNASKNIVQSYKYESFGMVTPQDPAFENAYTYTGREWDRETGFYYYRARYYDPMEGRFVSSDPIGLEGGDINLYGYVRNNAINNIDPTGENTIAIGVGIGGSVGGPIGAIIGAGIGAAAGYGIYQLCRDDGEEEQKRKNCQALKNSILKTCAGLTGRAKFRCFAAADKSYRQCMGYE